MRQQAAGLLAITLCVALSACATAKKPQAVAETTPPARAEEPKQQAQATPVASGIRPGSKEDFAQNAGERVFFALDRSDLDDTAKGTLGQQADWLRRYPGAAVVIAGSADERGTREYNLALGARRAAAARDHLVSQGVSANRLSTVSYGKERPIAVESTEEAWAQNRNATTIVD